MDPKASDYETAKKLLRKITLDYEELAWFLAGHREGARLAERTKVIKFLRDMSEHDLAQCFADCMHYDVEEGTNNDD